MLTESKALHGWQESLLKFSMALLENLKHNHGSYA
jgi:hypothetical protein